MKNLSGLKLPPLASIGDSVSSICTPSLILDLAAFEANIRSMADLANSHGVALRPHAKAHKSSDIAKLQMEMGAVGICCQKLREAYPFAANGIKNIHISNGFVGNDKVWMAIELAGHINLSVCVDHIAQIDELGSAAADAGVSISIFPEIDVGQGRCGVSTTEELIRLIDRLASHSALRFGGLQSYHGGIQHLAAWDVRRQSAIQAADLTAKYVQYLDVRGIACPVVTGGGTGTAEFDAASGVFSEIQPGSYIFMDRHYGSNEWAGELQLQQSLFVVTTIMSTAKAGTLICDVGLKGLAVDSGLPAVSSNTNGSHLTYIAANDEHGILADASGMPDRLGERLQLIPGHCDPTANLYDQYVCIRDKFVECVWDVDARGLSQ